MKDLSVKEKRAIIQDFIHKSTMATMGLRKIEDIEIKETISNLIQIGKISSEEGSKLLDDLLSKMKSSKLKFENRIDYSISETMSKLELSSKRQLKSLTKKVDFLEKRIDQLIQQKAANL